jgi:hypothetical protein
VAVIRLVGNQIGHGIPSLMIKFLRSFSRTLHILIVARTSHRLRLAYSCRTVILFIIVVQTRCDLPLRPLAQGTTLRLAHWGRIVGILCIIVILFILLSVVIIFASFLAILLSTQLVAVLVGQDLLQLCHLVERVLGDCSEPLLVLSLILICSRRGYLI